jgi:hypothetical protein
MTSNPLPMTSQDHAQTTGAATPKSANPTAAAVDAMAARLWAGYWNRHLPGGPQPFNRQPGGVQEIWRNIARDALATPGKTRAA